DDYQAWLWGEVLLIGLLGAALALFVAYPNLRNTYSLPQVRLVLDTAVTLAAAIVALLAGLRFSVDGRRLDLLLCGGFAAAAASPCRRCGPSWRWSAGGSASARTGRTSTAGSASPPHWRCSLSSTTSSRRCSPATTSRRATSCASSRTACCWSASGGRSASRS